MLTDLPRYWVPNVSGGLVISKIPQRTNWDFHSNVEYAQTAEQVGFEFALSQIRFMAGYGAVREMKLWKTEQKLSNALGKSTRVGVLFASPVAFHGEIERDRGSPSWTVEPCGGCKGDCEY